MTQPEKPPPPLRTTTRMHCRLLYSLLVFMVLAPTLIRHLSGLDDIALARMWLLFARLGTAVMIVAFATDMYKRRNKQLDHGLSNACVLLVFLAWPFVIARSWFYPGDYDLPFGIAAYVIAALACFGTRLMMALDPFRTSVKGV